MTFESVTIPSVTLERYAKGDTTAFITKSTNNWDALEGLVAALAELGGELNDMGVELQAMLDAGELDIAALLAAIDEINAAMELIDGIPIENINGLQSALDAITGDPTEAGDSLEKLESRILKTRDIASLFIDTSFTRTVTDLRAGDVVSCASYFAPSLYPSGEPTGAGVYNVVAAATHTANGGTVIDYGGVQLVLKDTAKVSLHQYGMGAAGVDDADQLQQFFSDLFASKFGIADANGRVEVTKKTIIGPLASPKVANKSITGTLHVYTKVNIDFSEYVLKIQETENLQWNGSILVEGGGNGSNRAIYANRTIENGTIFGSNTGFRITGGIKAKYARVFGCALGGGSAMSITNNAHQLDGDNRVFYCGSGGGTDPSKDSYDPLHSLGSTFSNATNNGTSGSVNQTTTIDVTTLPPVTVRDGEYMSNQVNIYINHKPYTVTNVDEANSQITFYPWIDNDDIAETNLYYEFGGAIGIYGNDTNVINIGTITTIRCGAALWDASLYGARVSSIVSQFDSSCVTYGANNLSQHLGGSVDGLYAEGVRNMSYRRSLNAKGKHIKVTVGELDQIAGPINPRFTSNALSTSYGIMSGVSYMDVDGNFINATSGQPPLNVEATNYFEVSLLNPRAPNIYRRDSATNISLVKGSEKDIGYFCTEVVFIGRATDGVPTGAFTFYPEAGDTITGGGASYTLSGFSGPVKIYIHYNWSTKRWHVYPDQAWTGW